MMKKILFALILTTTLGALHAQNLSSVSNVLERQMALEKFLFVNQRVKQMCYEWPTCDAWALNRILKDSRFQVIDAEVERWVSRWENGQAVWRYRFYVQTNEDGEIKAYAFTRGETGYSYAAPVQIKKFPGHPVPTEPSKHLRYEKLFAGKNHYAFMNSLCYNWPGCTEFQKSYDLTRALTSQYIVKWDAQGNAVWKRRLYVEVSHLLHARAFYFQAQQTQAGGDYNYLAPQEIKNCPTRPRF